MRLSIVMAVLLLAGRAHALELKNDSVVEGSTVSFQGGFVAGEIGAARFTAPAPGLQLQKVRFLFGGVAGNRTITLHVYDDSAGTITFSAVRSISVMARSEAVTWKSPVNRSVPGVGVPALSS
jgi:hypothetical protein